MERHIHRVRDVRIRKGDYVIVITEVVFEYTYLYTRVSLPKTKELVINGKKCVVKPKKNRPPYIRRYPAF